MILHSYFRSSAAYRVRIALNLKGIPHELAATNLLEGQQRSEAYLALNPQGLLPTLELDDGQLLTQSAAILEWLEEQYPGTPLYPKSPLERARVKAMVYSIACDIHPLNNLRVLKYLKQKLEADQEQVNTWYRHWINEGFAALEQQIKGAPYCWGEELTMADIFLIPQVYNALRFEVDMSALPKIQAIYDACNKLPAFIDAHPDNQADKPN